MSRLPRVTLDGSKTSVFFICVKSNFRMCEFSLEREVRTNKSSSSFPRERCACFLQDRATVTSVMSQNLEIEDKSVFFVHVVVELVFVYYLEMVMIY